MLLHTRLYNYTYDTPNCQKSQIKDIFVQIYTVLAGLTAIFVCYTAGYVLTNSCFFIQKRQSLNITKYLIEGYL